VPPPAADFRRVLAGAAMTTNLTATAASATATLAAALAAVANGGELFFDTWGGLWEVVPPSHPDAVAFGPKGTARELRGAAYRLFRAAGAVDRDRDGDGWDYVKVKVK